MTILVPTADEFAALSVSVAKLAGRVAVLESAQPVPVPGVTAPAQAVAAGYRNMVFGDEFDYAPGDMNWLGLHAEPGKKWWAGRWYAPLPDKSLISCANSIVTITGADIASVMATDPVPATGYGYAGTRGYYEAMVYCTNWSAFWMMSLQHMQRKPTSPANPMTWTAELDIVETGSNVTDGYYTTLHKSTSGDAGVPDAQNPVNHAATGTNVNNAWNKFGALVTDSEISWWFNDKKVNSFPPYASTLQPMAIILGVEAGSIVGGPTAQPVVVKCDWVRVWG